MLANYSIFQLLFRNDPDYTNSKFWFFNTSKLLFVSNRFPSSLLRFALLYPYGTYLSLDLFILLQFEQPLPRLR